MTYEKIFADVKKIYSKTDKSKLCGDFAFQFNITGEGGGAFYVAFRGGILEIAPYDYVDRDALLTASGEDFIKLAGAKFSLSEAVESGIIHIEGNLEMAFELDKMAHSSSGRDGDKKKKEATVKKAAPLKKAKSEEPAPAEPVKPIEKAVEKESE